MSSGPVRTNRKDKSTRKNKPYDRITESSPLKSPQTPSKSILQRAKDWLTPSSWKKTIAFLSKIPSEESEDEDQSLITDSSEEIKSEEPSFQKQPRAVDSPKTPSIVPHGSLLPPASSQESPNQLLATFFSNKGKQPLNEVEREGVLSLLSKDNSPASTTHPSPSIPSQQFSTPKYVNPHRAVSSESRIQTASSFHASPNSPRQWSAFRSTFSPILENSKSPNTSGNSLLSAQKTSYYGPTISTPFRKKLQRKRHSTTPVGTSKLTSLISSTTPDFAPKRSKHESFNGSFTANEDSFSTVPASSPFPPAQSTPQQKTPSRTAANLMSILESKEKLSTSPSAENSASTAKTSYISPYARPSVTTSRRRHTLSKDEVRPLKTIEEKQETPAVETLEKSSNLQTYKPDFTPQFLKEPSLSETKKETEPASQKTDTGTAKATPLFKFTAPATSSSTSFSPQSTKPFENVKEEKPTPAADKNEAIDVDMEELKEEPKEEKTNVSSIQKPETTSEKQSFSGFSFANLSKPKPFTASTETPKAVETPGFSFASTETPKAVETPGFSFGSLTNHSAFTDVSSLEQKKDGKPGISSIPPISSAVSAAGNEADVSQTTKEPKPFSFASSPKVDEKPKETPVFTFGNAGENQTNKEPKPFSFPSSPKVDEKPKETPVFTFGSTRNNAFSSATPVMEKEHVEETSLPQFSFTVLPKKDIPGGSVNEKALSATDEVPSFSFSTLEKKDY
ncbi:nucleoporin Nup60 [Schizosaccharomyces cryophilus OY26]|uniref:Nucleoporin Nup60 n=1 Tax=Schizosaccharomyces cryophilus (strain OY26 / ATCC MYA-4695 / CBS 11777 / NBRC 106824 / NRRL Y48691) TaxID=653667 RepID=S9VYS9_SCHCR|nr:nucleoporin Nup60 [Schizosaccharomyces cryophilus OY26]EPY51364.1 nucleoporin Nup60 [Schizosaccharomyces cryophilus OY26]